ncbi:putative acetyltransferase, GNAT [Dictyobacter alpinus]|uniref:Putative acetyltransferase, GNAT n=1 Tax=Dictyobacter alpinus TaxID=2014873 RepID=A0A402B1Q2_9CHLR|nr:GNAT family N-acetyltransferase [Dictyobacter alpinus]GCE25285.1 putative acetyltransferase, GNAT [Dictyobacter alpinus]
MTTLANTFTMRSLTLEDVEKVFALTSASQLHWLGRVDMSLDEVRLLLSKPGIDLAKDSLIILSADNIAVGYALMDHTQHARLYVRCTTHPAYLEDGIDDFLLEKAEEWGQQQIPLAEPDVRVDLRGFTMNENTALRKAFARHNFQPIRTFWRMGIELLTQPVAPRWPENIRIVTATPDLFHAIYEADEDIFKDHWGFIHQPYERWAYWSVEREDFDPSLWYIAIDGNEIAGIALCGIEKGSDGWVHDLGIRRAWRRQGLALSLLYHVFTEFYQRDIHQVYLSVDAASLTGATRLYERAGMHVVQQSTQYEKELRGGKELGTRILAE